MIEKIKTFMNSFVPYLNGKFFHFIYYFLGFLTGIIFCILIYFLFFMKKLKKELKNANVPTLNLSEEEVRKLIHKFANKFKTEVNTKKDEYMDILIDNIKLLSHEIVVSFYPNSPYPYLELTIDESLLLMKYFEKRLDKLFQNNILKFFRSMTLRKIFVLRKIFIEKSVIENYKKANKKITFVSNITNAVNPFYWFKKVVLDKSMNLIFSKMGESIIIILGEEIYKIYSKKMFNYDDQKPEKDLIELCVKLKSEQDAQNKKNIKK